MKKAIHWIPRILSLLLIGLLVMLSFDVFNQPTWKEVLIGFIIHNIPSMILILLTILAWRRPWIGGLTYLSGGLLYVYIAFTRMTFSPEDALIASMILSLPALIIAALYFLDWRLSKLAKP